MTSIRTARYLTILSIISMAAAATTATAQAQSGTKQAEKLRERAGETVDAMRAARLQVGSTLAEYNTILEGEAEDNRAAYKQLQKALTKSEESAVDVLSAIGRMEEVANEYFESWEGSLAGFSSEDMKARSKERLADTQERYQNILRAARESGQAFSPFVTQLKDQILFLGHDLNPSAIAALAPDAEKLNAQATEVFSDVDKTIATASEYSESLEAD